MSDYPKERDPQFISELIDLMHSRRSVRKFLDKPVSDEVLFKILNAGIRAPFAAQLCSMVYTRDKEKIKEYGMGAYPTTDVLIIFFVDARRLDKIVEQRGYQYDADDTMTLWLGIQDASLLIENTIMTAEALGLGSVLLGAAPMGVDRIKRIFNMPDKRVFPVVGMCLGFPDPEENTQIRPRFPIQHSVYEDEFRDLSEDDIKECMKEMDEGYLAQDYYISRNAKIPLTIKDETFDYSNYSWSEHISRKVIHGGYKKSLYQKLIKYGFKIE
jgi:nitroreductase